MDSEMVRLTHNFAAAAIFSDGQRDVILHSVTGVNQILPHCRPNCP
jgi:hypothetical protein